MTEEILEEEILAEELADDALEKKMRKLEAEAARILQQSDELIREMNKARAKKEEELAQDEVKLEEGTLQNE